MVVESAAADARRFQDLLGTDVGVVVLDEQLGGCLEERVAGTFVRSPARAYPDFGRHGGTFTDCLSVTYLEGT